MKNLNRPQPEWMTLETAAIYYATPLRTLKDLIFRKHLGPTNGAHKIGGRWKINRREFEQLFIDRAHRRGAADQESP